MVFEVFFFGREVLCTVFMVFSLPKTLVKTLAKTLVKNLAKNLIKNLIKHLSPNQENLRKAKEAMEKF